MANENSYLKNKNNKQWN